MSEGGRYTWKMGEMNSQQHILLFYSVFSPLLSHEEEAFVSPLTILHLLLSL